VAVKNTSGNDAAGGYIAGINIGGTTCSVVLATPEAAVLGQQAFPTFAQASVEETIAQFFGHLDNLLAAYNLAPGALLGIGISCGGPLDAAAGLILSPPNLPGWDRVPIVARFEQRYGVPASLENDANAGALAEWRFGAGRGAQNLIFLTFGTGMGAGLILDGRLYAGTNGMAGEIGHVRLTPTGPRGYGKAGSVEGYCSGGGIAQVAAAELEQARQAGRDAGLLGRLPDPQAVTAKDVAEAAQAGDALALRIFETTGAHLGAALSILIDLLNPERIVIGSIYTRCEQFIAPAMQAVIAAEALELSRDICRVVPAALSENIGNYAALSVALRAAGMLNADTP
jgi:glucokinase